MLTGMAASAPSLGSLQFGMADSGAVIALDRVP